ncbi:hypothetical protein RND81_01G004700 [Saponaria officinalis]|uniref:KIB1-4 beta-propeller domain-containing protein n=1 Tax=Saponaria officinalis TaxID=3572 RepID=A0AAW1NF23_SAPOF
MSEERGWSEMNADILLAITECLKTYSDYIHVRSVCRAWRRILPQLPDHRLPTQLPWLLRPPSLSNAYRREFYYLPTCKTNSLRLYEVSYAHRIVGSSHGSLVLVHRSPDIFCYNPITKFKAFLAPLSTLPGVVSFDISNVGHEYSIQDPLFQNIYTLDFWELRDVILSKVILSSSPTKNACLAVAIISWCNTTELAYCKCGDSNWKSLPFTGFSAQDVIYCQSEDLFYAVDIIGDVAVFSPPNNLQIIRNIDDPIAGDSKYLVKSSKGELLLVARCLEAQPDLVNDTEVYETTGFRVYKFSNAGKWWVHWEPMTDLGDEMVFIGYNMSLGLSASDFEGCNGNCIYYADDHSEKADAGVYDLSNDCISALPYDPHDGCSPLSLPPPVWFSPNPC